MQPGHFVWPVTMMTNAWQTTESWWNPPKLLSPLSPLLLSMTHMQSPLYWSSDRGQQPCYKLVAYVWHPDKYLRHLLTESMPSHMWQQCCVRGASTLAWFTAEPKKHGRFRHSWSFLTESRNSINTLRYEPFPLSLSIYSCFIQQLFEWGQFFTQLMRKFYWT